MVVVDLKDDPRPPHPPTFTGFHEPKPPKNLDCGCYVEGSPELKQGAVICQGRRCKIPVTLTWTQTCKDKASNARHSPEFTNFEPPVGVLGFSQTGVGGEDCGNDPQGFCCVNTAGSKCCQNIVMTWYTEFELPHDPKGWQTSGPWTGGVKPKDKVPQTPGPAGPVTPGPAGPRRTCLCTASVNKGTTKTTTTYYVGNWVYGTHWYSTQFKQDCEDGFAATPSHGGGYPSFLNTNQGKFMFNPDVNGTAGEDCTDPKGHAYGCCGQSGPATGAGCCPDIEVFWAENWHQEEIPAWEPRGGPWTGSVKPKDKVPQTPGPAGPVTPGPSTPRTTCDCVPGKQLGTKTTTSPTSHGSILATTTTEFAQVCSRNKVTGGRSVGGEAYKRFIAANSNQPNFSPGQPGGDCTDPRGPAYGCCGQSGPATGPEGCCPNIKVFWAEYIPSEPPPVTGQPYVPPDTPRPYEPPGGPFTGGGKTTGSGYGVWVCVKVKESPCPPGNNPDKKEEFKCFQTNLEGFLGNSYAQEVSKGLGICGNTPQNPCTPAHFAQNPAWAQNNMGKKWTLTNGGHATKVKCEQSCTDINCVPVSKCQCAVGNGIYYNLAPTLQPGGGGGYLHTAIFPQVCYESSVNPGHSGDYTSNIQQHSGKMGFNPDGTGVLGMNCKPKVGTGASPCCETHDPRSEQCCDQVVMTWIEIPDPGSLLRPSPGEISQGPSYGLAQGTPPTVTLGLEEEGYEDDPTLVLPFNPNYTFQFSNDSVVAQLASLTVPKMGSADENNIFTEIVSDVLNTYLKSSGNNFSQPYSGATIASFLFNPTLIQKSLSPQMIEALGKVSSMNVASLNLGSLLLEALKTAVVRGKVNEYSPDLIERMSRNCEFAFPEGLPVSNLVTPSGNIKRALGFIRKWRRSVWPGAYLENGEQQRQIMMLHLIPSDYNLQVKIIRQDGSEAGVLVKDNDTIPVTVNVGPEGETIREVEEVNDFVTLLDTNKVERVVPLVSDRDRAYDFNPSRLSMIYGLLSQGVQSSNNNHYYFDLSVSTNYSQKVETTSGFDPQRPGESPEAPTGALQNAYLVRLDKDSITDMPYGDSYYRKTRVQYNEVWNAGSEATFDAFVSAHSGYRHKVYIDIQDGWWNHYVTTSTIDAEFYDLDLDEFDSNLYVRRVPHDLMLIPVSKVEYNPFQGSSKLTHYVLNGPVQRTLRVMITPFPDLYQSNYVKYVLKEDEKSFSGEEDMFAIRAAQNFNGATESTEVVGDEIPDREPSILGKFLREIELVQKNYNLSGGGGVSSIFGGDMFSFFDLNEVTEYLQYVPTLVRQNIDSGIYTDGLKITPVLRTSLVNTLLTSERVKNVNLTDRRKYTEIPRTLDYGYFPGLPTTYTGD